MNRRKNIVLLIALLTAQFSWAQIGGESTYGFLSIPATARSTSLANSGIAIWDSDINLSQYNPSLLDSTLDGSFSLNYADYISDVNFGTVSFAKHYQGIGTFSAGIQYFNYGKFTEADISGVKTGTFTSSDYALNLSYARPLNKRIQAGVQLKILYSDYHIHSSAGIALDGGLTYRSEDGQTGLALVFQNLGTQIKPYREGNYENLPFDLQFGFAKKFAHAPFRLMFSLHHLNNWSLAYDNPTEEETSILGESDIPQKKSGFDKFSDGFSNATDEFVRHLNVAVEILPVKNLYLRIGYNFQRYKELAIKDKFGMTGFTFGVGLRIYKFHISYSRAVYHLAGVTNVFSITSNLKEFIK